MANAKDDTFLRFVFEISIERMFVQLLNAHVPIFVRDCGNSISEIFVEENAKSTIFTHSFPKETVLRHSQFIKQASGTYVMDVDDKSAFKRDLQSLKAPIPIVFSDSGKTIFLKFVSENANLSIVVSVASVGNTILSNITHPVNTNSSITSILDCDISNVLSFLQYEKQLLFKNLM